MRHIALTALLALAACATPPPDKYVTASGGPGHTSDAPQVPVGANASGEACTQQPGSSGDVFVYCGTWDQPSGHIAPFAATTASLEDVATSSPWRASLDVRFVCAGHGPATFAGGAPAILIRCTRKIGGWPQIAFVTRQGDKVFVGDGVAPAQPALERGVGVLAGRLEPVAPPSAVATGEAALAARRLAARALGSGDIGQYEALMTAGARANQTGDYAAAEQAYRAAVAVQKKALGNDNPNVATPLMHQALQISDQGRFAEADALFASTEPLTRSPALTDKTAAPRLAHYRALGLLNEKKPEDALALLRAAEAQYTALVPADMMRARPAIADSGAARLADQLGDQDIRADPIARNALIGVIETRRNEAVALRMLGREQDSEREAASASDLATRARNVARTAIPARLLRTAAFASGGPESGASVALLSQSSNAFDRALPASKPAAVTRLLLAEQLTRRGRDGDAADSCEVAVTALRALRTGVPGELMEPCLGAFGRAAVGQSGAAKQATLAKMFEAAQLAQGSVTGQQIAQASALLAENARDPRVADAIRRRDQTAAALERLVGDRDALATGPGGARADTTAIDKQIADARAAQADADAALQTASPNYGQLVQQVVGAPEIFAALRPREAFAAIAFGRDSGWVFLLTDGRIAVAPVAGGPARAAELVKRVRASMESEVAGPPPPFDTEASEQLFTSVFGGVRGDMEGLTAMTVAPTGPLLSVPFALLLTGPATPATPATSPWLVRKMAVAHVPAAANFVTLRKVAGNSRATRPWFGFGDFRPVTLAQAQRSFPSAACADSARLLAGLPPLPGAKVELTAAQKLLGAGAGDELLAGAFTADAVLREKLADFRVLHFATHALLPTDLKCQNEPAIVTSAPAGAPDARGALLTASAVSRMELDAEAVILSACNTGGPAGGAAGESLSGLARSFFFAGARSLLITHWSVNDQFTAYLVALTLNAAKKNPAQGLSAALRSAQLQILDEATGAQAAQAHPFFWAPLALIGDGGGAGSGRLAAR